MDEAKKEGQGFLASLSKGGRGQTAGIVIGLIVGLLITVLGALKSLILALCVLVGYLAGKYYDEEIAAKKGATHEERRHLSDPPGVP
jgi:uncharacterized membrane protein